MENIHVIIGNAFMLWSASRRDYTAEGRALYKVLSNPLVGDMVLEITRALRAFDPAGLGRLVNVRRETVRMWEGSEPAPVVVVYDVDAVSGESACWYNCHLIRVLETVINPIEEAQSRGLLQYE